MVDISCTSSEHSRAVEVVFSNEDLLTEILFLVPAKPLLKCESVSKHWHSLISNSRFGSNHSCRNASSSLISGLYFYFKHSCRNVRSSSGLYFVSKHFELKSVSLHGHRSLPTLAFLDPGPEEPSFKVVDSCNGLMLVSNGGRLRYFVCNPTTQKYVALPEPSVSTSYRSVGGKFGAYLAFDPSKSPYYKVVLVVYHHGCKEIPSFYLIYIYSSKTASWKEIHAKAPQGGSYQCRAFCNGAIHWMNCTNVHIRFDVDEENLTGTIMPKVPNILGEDKMRYFGECGGSLLLIQTREYYALKFRILEMEKDCCRWIVKYRVNMTLIRSLFDGYIPQFGVLCCANVSGEKDPLLLLAIRGKVVAYNPNVKSFKVLLDLDCNTERPCYEFYGITYRFIESLSPV